MSSESKKRKNSNGGLDRSFCLKKVEPKTPSQCDTFDAYSEGYNLVLHGVAGTGKSFISLWLALNDVLAGKFKKVIVVRSIVSSRDPGFLPGTLEEKQSIYEEPIRNICNELFGRGDAYNVMKTKESLEFMTTSFIRGTTWSDAVVIVDEIQNCNFEELDTIMTRIGNNCRVILCGDIEQSDLHRSKFDKSGLPHFMDIVEQMESIELIEFGPEDIVRSGFCKEWILAKRKIENYI